MNYENEKKQIQEIINLNRYLDAKVAVIKHDILPIKKGRPNKGYLTFKQRYNKDLKYKENHLKYINQKIPCDCGMLVCRCYMSKHQNTQKHQRLTELKLNSPSLKFEQFKRIQTIEDSIVKLKSMENKLYHQINVIKNKFLF